LIGQSGDFIRSRPEVLGVAWVTPDRQIKASRSTMRLPLDPGASMALPAPNGNGSDRRLPADTFDPFKNTQESLEAFRVARERGVAAAAASPGGQSPIVAVPSILTINTAHEHVALADEFGHLLRFLA
jgi:hypothetical protein